MREFLRSYPLSQTIRNERNPDRKPAVFQSRLIRTSQEVIHIALPGKSGISPVFLHDRAFMLFVNFFCPKPGL